MLLEVLAVLNEVTQAIYLPASILSWTPLCFPCCFSTQQDYEEQQLQPQLWELWNSYK